MFWGYLFVSQWHRDGTKSLHELTKAVSGEKRRQPRNEPQEKAAEKGLPGEVGARARYVFSWEASEEKFQERVISCVKCFS